MNSKILGVVSAAILLALPASGSMVRGTISDSTTGAPTGNVKVVLMQIAGEIDRMIDSSITGPDGSYGFTFSGQSSCLLVNYYIYTIAKGYYFQSMDIGIVGINDTITKNIKLKKTPTMVSAATLSKELPNITVGAAKSRLFLSGVKAGAIVDLYTLNGRLLFRTVVPAGASEVIIPERIAAVGCYQVSIKANGSLLRGVLLSK